MSAVKPLPVSHGLRNQMYLPLGQLQATATALVAELAGGPRAGHHAQAEELLDGVLHHYFVDADARRLSTFNDRWCWTRTLQRAVQELQLQLHQLVQSTCGPLMPSFLYRYEVQGDTLQLVPTLPTITDYEKRIAEMADPEDGWVPSSQRR